MKGTLVLAISTALLIASPACGQEPGDESRSTVPLATSPVPAPTSVSVAPSATPPSPIPSSIATPVPSPTPAEDPGYGGFFFDRDDDSIVYIYLVNPSQEAAEEVARRRIGNILRGRNVKEIRPLKARYTWEQMHMWRDRIADTGVFSLPEWVTYDIDEELNLIEIGIDCESNRERVEREIQDRLTSANIPVDVVLVVVRMRPTASGPFRFECAPAEKIDPVTGVSSPGFGGMFWEGEWPSPPTLNVYMLEPSRKAAEDLALQVVGQENLERVSEVRALQGQYTWEQLLGWYWQVETAGLNVPGARLVPDFMEQKNRLMVEIDSDRNSRAEVEIEDLLDLLGIPLEAVVLQER